MSLQALDLFAGPGGWDTGAAALGVHPLGVELDEGTCATREAAGHRTLRADVATLEPAEYAPCELLIGSPPCPTFSAAGNREGVVDYDEVYRCLLALGRGEDERATYRERCSNPLSLLTVEPLRFALALRPRYVALEQVPDVLDLWRHTAEALRHLGYTAWAGVLNAADYGVPQTRRRAFMLASLGAPAEPPTATHAREATAATLFGPELLPWVTMAEALGWEAGIIGFPRLADTPSNGAGDNIVTINGTDYRGRDLRSVGEPAPTLTEKARAWKRWLAPGLTPSQVHRRLYDPEAEPAPTVAFGNDAGGWRWVLDSREAPTLAPKRGIRWWEERPATTIQGDPRVFHPGGHIANDGRDNSKMVGRSEDAIRVSVAEAAALQTFPIGYPWQGPRSRQFHQIGNAVPPLLAHAVLRHLLREEF